MPINKLITEIREKVGLSKKDFAKKLHITEVYLASLERGKKEGYSGKVIPSVALIKKIAEIAASNKEERELIEKKLLIERVKDTSPKQLESYFQEKKPQEAELLMTGGMPIKYINQIKKDINEKYKTSEDINVFYNELNTQYGISRKEIESMLAGTYTMNRKKVISLAMMLNKPVEEYLMLAEYFPDEVKSFFENKKNTIFFRQLSTLSAEDIDKMIDVFDTVLKAFREKYEKRGKQ